jgi:hypothetical protein
MDDRRVHGWKGIGAHLGVSVRTAERWHDQWGLPVHRATLGERTNVWGVSDELDAWLESREGMAARGDEATPEIQLPERAPGADRGRWWVGAAIALGFVVITGVVWTLVSSNGGAGRAPNRPKGNGAGPPAQTVAASDSVLALDVIVAEDETYTVRVLDGGLVTVARPEGGKIGLGPVRRGTRLTVLLFALNRAAGNAAESGRQLDRLELLGGVPMPLRVSGTPVALTWRSPEHVEISAARPADPCCVACAEATVCGLSVRGPCGACGTR